MSFFREFFDWIVLFFTETIWVWLIELLVWFKVQSLIVSIKFAIQVLDKSIIAVQNIILDVDIFGRFSEFFDLIPDEVLSILTLLNAQACITIVIAAYVARMVIDTLRTWIPGL